MSLKAVHLVFITASCLLAFGFAAWCFLSPDRAPRDFGYGVGSLVAGAALIFYGRYFLKKLKNVRYL